VENSCTFKKLPGRDSNINDNRSDIVIIGHINIILYAKKQLNIINTTIRKPKKMHICDKFFKVQWVLVDNVVVTTILTTRERFSTHHHSYRLILVSNGITISGVNLPHIPR
jgi:hypothetical protein